MRGEQPLRPSRAEGRPGRERSVCGRAGYLGAEPSFQRRELGRRPRRHDASSAPPRVASAAPRLPLPSCPEPQADPFLELTGRLLSSRAGRAGRVGRGASCPRADFWLPRPTSGQGGRRPGPSAPRLPRGRVLSGREPAPGMLRRAVPSAAEDAAGGMLSARGGGGAHGQPGTNHPGAERPGTDPQSCTVRT